VSATDLVTLLGVLLAAGVGILGIAIGARWRDGEQYIARLKSLEEIETMLNRIGIAGSDTRVSEAEASAAHERLVARTREQIRMSAAYYVDHVSKPPPSRFMAALWFLYGLFLIGIVPFQTIGTPQSTTQVLSALIATGLLSMIGVPLVVINIRQWQRASRASRASSLSGVALLSFRDEFRQTVSIIRGKMQRKRQVKKRAAGKGS
jgi:hypothetical protein